MLSLPKHLGRFVERLEVNKITMYLHPLELSARINLGKEVEQWLSYEQESDYAFIKWIIIYRDKDLFSVTYRESFDEGDDYFHDVSEFSALDPEDNPFGITNEFDSAAKAIAFACEKYGADDSKFVTGGMIQLEYLNHLHQNKK